ncbi:hypothetical protein D3C87_2160300 [compost metagenome]
MESWQRRLTIGDIDLLKFAFYLVRLSEHCPDLHEVFRRSATIFRTANHHLLHFDGGRPCGAQSSL